MTSPRSERRKALLADPSAFGFLALMREVERAHPDRPRIGRNQTLAQEVIRLGQEPFLAHPDRNVSQAEEREDGRLRVRSNFLGYFGPQGALPVNTTAEVYQWYMMKDEAFVRLADLFTNRFQQLFFRVWSNARGITQLDHPDDDRFQAYVGAVLGLASPALRGRGTVPDMARLPLAGLAMGRVKSPVRLRQMLEQLCLTDITIEEHVPTWLSFEAGDLTKLGRANARLGQDCRLGARVQTVNEKIRVGVGCATLAEYQSYLPGGRRFQRLTELLFSYLGHGTEVEIAPSLPTDQAAPMQLGRIGALGWTGWVAPKSGQPGERRCDASFSSTHRVA